MLFVNGFLLMFFKILFFRPSDKLYSSLARQNQRFCVQKIIDFLAP